MNPTLPDKPLSKEERKKILAITAEDIESAIARTKRSMTALVQSDVE